MALHWSPTPACLSSLQCSSNRTRTERDQGYQLPPIHGQIIPLQPPPEPNQVN